MGRYGAPSDLCDKNDVSETINIVYHYAEMFAQVSNLLMHKWATSSEKIPSNMHKMLRFRSSCTCSKYHPVPCSLFIHSVVSSDSISGQWSPWRCAGWSGPSLSAYAQRQVFSWSGPSAEFPCSKCFQVFDRKTIKKTFNWNGYSSSWGNFFWIVLLPLWKRGLLFPI